MEQPQGLPHILEGTRAEDPVAMARRLEADGIAAFSGLANDLSAIRDRHAAIGDALGQFAGLVGVQQGAAGEVEPLDALERGVERLGAALRDYITVTGGPEARKGLRRTGGYLRGIGQTGKTLMAIASLTRTTAASLGVTSLARYLQDLRETADQICRAASAVEEQLVVLDRREKETLDRCPSAEAALVALAPRLSAGRDGLDALTVQEARIARDIGSRAAALAERGRSRIKAFIIAMQFSDRLAQRLDHLALMLDQPGAFHLAAAQARGCAADIATTVAAVDETMRALSDLGEEGAALFSEGAIASAIAAAEKARAETAALVEEEMRALDPLVRMVRDSAGQAARTGADARHNFDMLEDGAKRLSIASINSMLLSTRSGDSGGPLVALSSEVRQAAAECLASVGGARAGLNAVLSRAEEGQEALTGAADALHAAMEAQSDLAHARAARLRKIEDLSANARVQTSELDRRIETVIRGMSALSAVGGRLEELASGLDQRSEAPPDPATLATIWDFYTMDEEREIHAALYSPHASYSGPSSNGADDLDDVFF